MLHLISKELKVELSTSMLIYLSCFITDHVYHMQSDLNENFSLPSSLLIQLFKAIQRSAFPFSNECQYDFLKISHILHYTQESDQVRNFLQSV